jgi:hypothetical protein
VESCLDALPSCPLAAFISIALDGGGLFCQTPAARNTLFLLRGRALGMMDMKTIALLTIALVLLSAAGCASIWPEEKGFRDLEHPNRTLHKNAEKDVSKPKAAEKKSRWDLRSEKTRAIEEHLGY